MDVGPLVIPHAQAAKLIQPRKRPLDHPPQPPEATPVPRATPFSLALAGVAVATVMQRVNARN